MLAFEGKPKYKSLVKYLEKNNSEEMLNLRRTKMRGSVTFEDLKSIRDMWDGILIIKGVLSQSDMEQCITLGADGVIVQTTGQDNWTGQTAIPYCQN